MKWLTRIREQRAQAEREAAEALAAKVQASIDLSVAQQTAREVEKQAEKIHRINRENHFSEGLTKAFHGRTA